MEQCQGSWEACFSSTQIVKDDQAISAMVKYINITLLYLFRKATKEFNAFHSAEDLGKIGV
jgi:hypothetical protein